MAAYRLEQLAQHLGARLHGDPNLEVSGLATLAGAQPGDLSHLSSPAYREQLPGTLASAVILKQQDVDACPCAALVVDNPYLAYARISHWFARTTAAAPGVHATAEVAADAVLEEGVTVEAHAVIGPGTCIARGAHVGANSVVGADCRVGPDVVLMANVTIYADVHIGARSVVHSGAVIGAEGFGFTPDERGTWQGIAQIGGVRIGADVLIGANTCIDCGAIEPTLVEDGVKIDNHVQIGHNCKIGAHSLLCGQVGLAGSSVIGRHCVLGGRAGVGGDRPVSLCDGVIVSSNTVISQSVDEPGIYSGGNIFHEHSTWRRNALRFASLDQLFKRVKRLENSHK